MSPSSTSHDSSTSPVSMSTMSATPSSEISKVLSWRAVLLGLLGHQADVGNGAHGRRVELAVGLTPVDHLLIDPREGRLGVDGLGVLGPSVGAVHLAAETDHRGHRGVHDHVAGRMEVGDSLGRIHHGQLGAVLVDVVNVLDDLLTLERRQRLDLVVEVDHSVVDVHAELVEHLLVLGERVLVEDLHAVTEDDGVADLHHRRLDVQREHHAGLVGILDLLLVELDERLLAHEHALDDVAVFQRRLGLEHDRVAALGLQLHPHLAVTIQGHRLLAVVEVATLHGGHVGARRLRELAHAVRVFARVLLDGLGGAAVRIALAQNGVHRAAEDLAVALLERLLLVGLRLRRIVGNRVPLLLQLLDRGVELRHRRADVRQLDDVGVG